MKIFDNTLGRLERSLDVRLQRHGVLSGNIANADTPGYVARDMNFAQALREATGTLKPVNTTIANPQPGNLAAGGFGARSETALLYANPSQTNLDRNTVDMDRERANFADNAVKYEATLRFINGDVKTMLDAIRG